MSATLDRLAASLADRYRLERELGAGGMATVYLAEDLKHGRQVAIKVLHPELSAVIGSERFLAEIKVTASLQHPHILPLFDSGTADGLLFYVMPYVEGETLRRRLAREHQLPLDDALRIAGDVADALEYAHRRGIVHRDIKPENVLLHEGRPLVADFGIALAVQHAGGSRMTQTGMSLGTPQYMAPEQAMGERAVDARADVYALGAMTYEMLAGEPPFSGPTPQAIVAKVMTERPRPLGELRDTVPAAAEAAVHRALQKLPADRWQAAADFARALRAPDVTASSARTVALPAATPIRRSRALAVAALAAAVALTSFLAGRAARPAAPVQASWLSIMAANVGGSGGPALNRQLALSPDGSSVIFVTVGADGQNRLTLQRLDSPQPRQLEGFVGTANPRFTPDGRTLLMLNTLALRTYRASIAGGAAQSLEAPGLTGQAGWDGETLVWFDGDRRTVNRLRLGGTVAATPLDSVWDLDLQQVLPGGREALVVRRPLGQPAGTLFAFDLTSGARRAVVEGAVVEARFAAGLLVYALNDGTLQAAPFDERAAEVTGPAVQLASGVSVTGTGYAQFDLAANGTLAYIPEEPRSLVLVDRDGSERPLTGERRNFHAPVFSPDGRRLSVDFVTGDGRDVWVLSLADGTLSRASFDQDGHDATWALDGRTLIYSSARSGVLGTYRVRPGNAERSESLFAAPSMSWSGAWLPDGSGIVTVMTDLVGTSGSDIVLLPGGRGPPVPLVASPFLEQYPVVSPDGRWLAFTSNQSGETEVYVRPLRGDGDQVQVSQGGGTEPLWSPDGRELFYRGLRNGRPELVAAAVAPGETISFSGRRALFPLDDIVGTNPHANFAVSPDGQHFAMVKRSPATRVTIVQNLPEIVRRMQRAGAAAP